MLDAAGGVPTRRASPLHAARGPVAAVWCLVLATLVLAFAHPLLLAALAVVVVLAAAGARAGGPVARSALFGLPLALLIMLLNPLLSHEGLTVFLRLGEVPPFGQLDLTLEALVYGAVLGARALLVIAFTALLAAVVDPDEMLRAFRRVSFRSAVTAALATRLVPVLARDARRMAAAQRCRPDMGPRPTAGQRVAVLRAVTASALDRAVDVAATLEVRGYGSARRAPRMPRPWSRHDLAFAASAVALAALGVLAAAGGAGRFATYPTIDAPVGPDEVALGVALLAAALLPFADRRGVER